MLNSVKTKQNNLTSKCINNPAMTTFKRRREDETSTGVQTLERGKNELQNKVKMSHRTLLSLGMLAGEVHHCSAAEAEIH